MVSNETVGVSDNIDEMPSVGIVVLTWQNYEDTVECLASLREVDYPNYDVVVVDNGSTDGSRERLVEEFDWCTFVLNEENWGFAAGNNPGIAVALSRGADHVLLLNNDTVVEPDFLDPLVETAETHDDVAVVTGVEYREGMEEVLNAGGRFYPYLGGRISPVREVKSDEPYEVSYAPSSFLLIDASFVRDHDVLHEGYFLGMDDVDLAVQARQSGMRVVLDPRSRIRHKEGLTNERSPFMNYHWMRNRLEFASQRLPIHKRVVFYGGFLITLVQFSSLWILTRRFDLLESTYVAFTDHFKGEPARPYEFFE